MADAGDYAYHPPSAVNDNAYGPPHALTPDEFDARLKSLDWSRRPKPLPEAE